MNADREGPRRCRRGFGPFLFRPGQVTTCRGWAETEKLFDGAATFRDSSDVTVDLHGDPDQAGFVQIMQGRGTDPERVKQLMAQDADKWAQVGGRFRWR